VVLGASEKRVAWAPTAPMVQGPVSALSAWSGQRGAHQ
jgi:hypothetical protein